MNEKRPPYRVLFLCTGNSARSILAEFLLRRQGRDRFEVWSAGARPRGRVNPDVLAILREVYRIDASEARSKSWEELRDVPFDFVITVCDRARESCPIWPGQPVVAHWGAPDPDDVQDEAERLRLVSSIAMELQRRIDLFCALPLESLDRLRIEERIKSIGLS